MGGDCVDVGTVATEAGVSPLGADLQTSGLDTPVFPVRVYFEEWSTCFSQPIGSFSFYHYVYCSGARLRSHQRNGLGTFALHNFCFSETECILLCLSINKCLYFRCQFWLGLQAHSRFIQHLQLESVWTCSFKKALIGARGTGGLDAAAGLTQASIL